jgi:predicted nucleotidyltransferase
VIDPATIAKAVDILLEAAPGAKVILFGSYARGDAREDSDVDFLVVQPGPKDEVEEMIRLRDLLRPLRIPADVLVTSQRHFDYWAETPGTVYHEAATEGRAFEALPRTG